jgi:hypothetical protein
VKDLLSDRIGKRDRLESCEGGIGAFKKTNDNSGLEDFVTSIVDNGIDDTMQEESEREEAPRPLKIYGTSNGRFQLIPQSFTFPSLTLASLVTSWYCGDYSKSIPPYRYLKPCDVKHIKGGRQKIMHMKILMSCVEKAAKIVNLPHLIKRKMNDKDAITLYNSVKHLFRIPAGEGKKRRYETLSWKTYYNMLSKRKWRLYGEKETARQETVTRVEHLMSETDKQVEQRRPKKRQRTLNTQDKRKKQMNNHFIAAFDGVPIVEQERPRKGMENYCCLGAECKNTHIKGTMKCHGDRCGNRIHHLCAITLNLLDKDNELNVFCSSKCMPTN